MTRLVAYERLSTLLGVDLRVKHDDDLPGPGGGNKLRKVGRILEGVTAKGTDSLVTTGGTQSNLARVVALVAARRGWPCHLVLHGAPAALARPTGNLLLMLLAGAHVTIGPPDTIPLRLEEAIGSLRQSRNRPLLIPGGGHCLEGALAYVEAVREVAQQSSGWVPDLIVLASGTGATQAGIVAGCASLGWSTKVVGISVGRPNPRGARAVREMCGEVAGALDLPEGQLGVDFRDEWVGAGYGHADERVLEAIRMAAREEALVLDPTYTGKAFLGLLDLIKAGEVKAGTSILFWHTGGIMNLLAQAFPSQGP